MKFPYLFGCILALALSATPASALEEAENQVLTQLRYKILDMGETEVDISQLSKLSGKLTLTSHINDQGLGIANTIKGGYVFKSSGWTYAPQVKGLGINFHAINNQGDILVSLTRGQESVEWMIWPLTQDGYSAVRNHVHTVDPFKSDFFLTAFNDQGMTVGYKKDKNKNIPIIWSLEAGVQTLGELKGLDLVGMAKAINQRGAVAGIADEITDRYPFFWKDNAGLEILKNYRTTLSPKGWVEFADMLLTNDDTVYGTFWIKNLTSPQNLRKHLYHAYRWEPTTGKVSMLSLQGMRMAAVNTMHTIVGSLNGQAVLSEKGQPPVELSSLIDQKQQAEWHLIESTAINDKGQIVGFGTYQGKTHIFFADPLL